MRHKVLAEGSGGTRTIIVVLDAGDEVTECLRKVADTEDLDASSFTAIGALEQATLGWYDLEVQDYQRIPVRQQAEVLALTGDITHAPQGRMVHAHAVLGLKDGSTRGGHLLAGVVRPTLELVLTETPARLARTFNPRVGLALIDLRDGEG
jgi:predicted DNA-binding protein with PD1-like motif